MAKAKVKNAADSWVNNGAQSKNYGQKQKLWLASSQKRSYIYFAKPWPNGVTIVSARLKVYQVENWTGSVTLTVQRAVSKWDVNKINWNNQPSTTGSSATLTKGAGGNAGTEWDIDVTPLVQAIANGSPWYGFRLTTNRVADGGIWSAQAPKGAYRPVLEVEWSAQPDEPTGLRPAGGRAVSGSQPTLSFEYNDPSGDDSLTSIQVQCATTEAAANSGAGLYFDSGEVATSVPELNLATTAFGAMAAGATMWWRVRAKDDTGLWSAWSDAVQWYRIAKGALTITAPSGGTMQDPTQVISWTFTGVTQRAFEASLTRLSDGKVLWYSGKITSTATSINIPEAAMRNVKFDSATQFRIGLRAYDNVAREGVPGDTAYVEAFWTGTFGFAATAHAITGLNAASDALIPVMHLTWSRASAPDSFAIYRSEDEANGYLTWELLDEELAAALSTGGTGYKYDDVTASPYKNYKWFVAPIIGGVQYDPPGSSPSKVRKLAPVLMRLDQSDVVCFLNPERERKRMDKQALHQPLGGPPVVVTQQLGGFGGHASGRFIDDAISGLTAKMMYDRFEGMRLTPGETLIYSTANETFRVVTYNMNTEVLVDASGISYQVEFDWVQVS